MNGCTYGRSENSVPSTNTVCGMYNQNRMKNKKVTVVCVVENGKIWRADILGCVTIEGHANCSLPQKLGNCLQSKSQTRIR